MCDYYIPNALPSAYLRADQAFALGGVHYPSGWLRLATPAEREALDIQPVRIGPRPDERYYWISEVRVDGAVSFIGAPKDLDVLKADAVSRVKTQAGGILASTDWKVVRAMERNEPLDSALAARRQAVRDASNAAETAVAACATVEDLAALPPTAWPEV